MLTMVHGRCNYSYIDMFKLDMFSFSAAFPIGRVCILAIQSVKPVHSILLCILSLVEAVNWCQLALSLSHCICNSYFKMYGSECSRSWKVNIEFDSIWAWTSHVDLISHWFSHMSWRAGPICHGQPACTCGGTGRDIGPLRIYHKPYKVAPLDSQVGSQTIINPNGYIYIYHKPQNSATFFRQLKAILGAPHCRYPRL